MGVLRGLKNVLCGRERVLWGPESRVCCRDLSGEC